MLYIADTYNQRIRKLTLSTGQLTTYCGAGGSGNCVDGSPTVAKFDCPVGLAVDGENKIFVCDNRNNAIRMIQPNGFTTTICGSKNKPGGIDGKKSVASLDCPAMIIIDKDGSLLFTQKNCIRKIIDRMAAFPNASSFGSNVLLISNLCLAAKEEFLTDFEIAISHHLIKLHKFLLVQNKNAALLLENPNILQSIKLLSDDFALSDILIHFFKKFLYTDSLTSSEIVQSQISSIGLLDLLVRQHFLNSVSLESKIQT